MSDQKLSLAITNKQLLKAIATYRQWWWLWIGSTAVFGCLGVFYAVFLKKDVWVASQALIVRDEANGAVMRLGRFQSQTEMKAAQETVLEMARNTQVLHQALRKIGPAPGGSAGPDWPDSATIEGLARAGIEVRAPRGAEFGTTEVIYLNTKHEDRQWAHDLNVAICDALESCLQDVRRVRADGVISELTTARTIARAELDKVTQSLQAIEREAGPDLADLRGMTDTASSTSNSRIQLDAVKAELRQAETLKQQMAKDLELLQEAFDDTSKLLAAPSSLLNAQPGLKKLREGLADARLNASQLQGRFTPSHPAVAAAMQAEKEIEGRLREELGIAKQAPLKDGEVEQQRLERLRRQQLQLEQRLERLAQIRAEYSNLANEVRSRDQILLDSERELADAQAARDAAVACSLITRLDKPLLGESPLGPGRSVIVAGAAVAGLFFGLGIVFLLSPLESISTEASFGRRSGDHGTPFGRRASDHMSNPPKTDGVNPIDPFDRRKQPRSGESKDRRGSSENAAPAGQGTSRAGRQTPASGASSRAATSADRAYDRRGAADSVASQSPQSAARVAMLNRLQNELFSSVRFASQPPAVEVLNPADASSGSDRQPTAATQNQQAADAEPPASATDSVRSRKPLPGTLRASP